MLTKANKRANLDHRASVSSNETANPGRASMGFHFVQFTRPPVCTWRWEQALCCVGCLLHANYELQLIHSKNQKQKGASERPEEINDQCTALGAVGGTGGGGSNYRFPQNTSTQVYRFTLITV